MTGTDVSIVYDPYGWRLEELDAPETSAERRRELAGELIGWEAEELAHGYRHVTVVHGDPADVEASRRISAFYDEVRGAVDHDAWARVRGSTTRVTITLGGAEAGTRAEALAAVAEAFGRGRWAITHGVAR